MKHICVPLSILGCLYASSVCAQQLVAPAGRESPAASWVIGEVVGGYYQADDGMVVQGILSYIDLSSSVGMEEDEWQEKTMIWPSPVVDYLNISIPPSASMASINIYSLKGILVGQFNILKSPSTYNVSFLASGIYSVQLVDINGKTVVTRKIIKQ